MSKQVNKLKPTVIAPASKKQEMFLNSDADITLAGGAAGSGKALKHGEKVHTPNGWVNIEDCKIGDVITSVDGKTQTITGVYPQGEVDIYRVTFQDGSYVDTCGDHLWQYHEARGRGKSKVNSTLYLKDRIEKGFRPIVPLCEPVQFNQTKELTIKPYTLGVLLGDGSITSKSISFTTQDDEIVNNVKLEGYELSDWESQKENLRVIGVLKIQEKLRSLNLLGCDSSTKFIPDEYFNASVQDKFSLVQGLMDTDGYVDANGSTQYCTISKSLAFGLSEILRSLGFTVTVSEKKTFFKYKGIKKEGSLAYNLYIRGNLQNKLFRLSRKLERVKSKKVGNRIVSIDKVGRDYATCISVSSEDKLFITTNYIVTHNTYTSLLIALKFMQHPRATGVIFRRTSKMLTSPGSIWHEAVNMYTTIYPKGLRIRHRELEIIFPNGALLKFSHMQHESNMYDHKGGQYSLVIFDEATDFTEEMIVYLLSRMRNAYVNYRPQMFLMTNPDYHSFLRKWIEDFYLDNRGIPLPERTGVKRYFVRQGNNMLWETDRSKLEELYGKGSDSGITSFTFIGANCLDNPPLLKAQPDYLSKLKSLPQIEMERLLLGSWFAREQSAGFFKREWVSMVTLPNLKTKKRVRAWDLAATPPSTANPDPDWTAGVLMSRDQVTGGITIEDVVRLRDRPHIVKETIFEVAEQDGRGVTIVLPLDPGATAGAYCRNLQRELIERGFRCKLVKPDKSKLNRFRPFSAISESKFVSVVKAPWNDDFFEELERFDGGKHSGHDDQADACSDGFYILCKELHLPDFDLPEDLTKAHPFMC